MCVIFLGVVLQRTCHLHKICLLYRKTSVRLFLLKFIGFTEVEYIPPITRLLQWQQARGPCVVDTISAEPFQEGVMGERLKSRNFYVMI